MTGPSETPAICITRARKLRLKSYLMRSGSLCDNYHAVFLPTAKSLALKYAWSRCTPSLPPSDRNCPRRERRGRMSGFTQQMRGGESSDLLGGEPLPRAARAGSCLSGTPLSAPRQPRPGWPSGALLLTSEEYVLESAADMIADTAALPVLPSSLLGFSLLEMSGSLAPSWCMACK